MLYVRYFYTKEVIIIKKYKINEIQNYDKIKEYIEIQLKEIGDTKEESIENLIKELQ